MCIRDSLWPGAQRLPPPLQLPPSLDLLAMFADDGVIAGRAVEALRVARRLRDRLLAPGLHFGKLVLDCQ